MPRYLIELAYHGGNYHGWQIQPNVKTVQEEIQIALSKLHGNLEIEVVGCGRTDTGVHAQQYFMHVDLSQLWEADQLVFKLNRMTPPDISFSTARLIDEKYHARFDAKCRTYRYFIHHKKNPFLQDKSWYVQTELNINAMNQAAEFLLGIHDFSSFAKAHTDVKTNICEVYSAVWKHDENGIYFEIKANRFLRNMVRAIVGTLIEVGLDKIKVSELPNIIAAQDRSEAYVSVPPQGLFLWKIDYPTRIFTNLAD